MLENPYEVLGVKEGASQAEIKAAYREQVKKYHPDKHSDNPLQELAEEKLQEINEAYDILSKNPGYKHTGGGSSSGRRQSGNSNMNNRNEFQEIRVNIDRGNIMAAEQMLNRLQPSSAEWYFLKGIVAQRKGWMDDAFRNIQTANAMEPSNFEYRQALNQMQGGAQQFRGNAYNRGYGSNNDDMCKICAGLACLDCMCDCM
jgi:molecular chaperone DnaJ